MGSPNIFTSLGVTMMLGIAFLVLAMLLVVILTLLCRKRLSEKNQKRLSDLRIKVFYSLPISFAMLNSLKFNLSGLMAMLVLKDQSWNQATISIILLIIINLLPLLLARILLMNYNDLDTEEMQKKYGDLYDKKSTLAAL